MIAAVGNPLDKWAARRAGLTANLLCRKSIQDYQLGAIRQTVAWARGNSSFYAARWAEFPREWPQSLDEFAQSSLTSPAELIDNGHAFVCVPQSEISRVVTLETSGTSGARKRVFFTAADQDLALDFFAHGVATMAEKGDRMFIALPGEREGSVGLQLARGVARAGVEPIPYGLIHNPSAALASMDKEKATLLIGLPVQALALALEEGAAARRVFRRLHTIVLCSDHVPENLVNRIRCRTGCEVFEHYGATEMGLGGGVDCRAHAGYHLREADLYFEIVSPLTGELLAEGQLGEVVFTTLGRTGMPLVRYRTGDLARMVPGPCSCGSALRRLSRIENRVNSAVSLGHAGDITISALDEALFALPEVHDFTATLSHGEPKKLELRVYAPNAPDGICKTVERALWGLPEIAISLAAGELRLQVSRQMERFPVTGAKRTIEVRAGS